MFALSLRVHGARTSVSYHLALMREGGKPGEEAARNQATLTWTQVIELQLEVYYSSFYHPQPKPDGLASGWPSR